MRIFLLIKIIMISFGSQANACDRHGLTGFVSGQQLSTPVVNSINGNGMTEEKFNQVIDKISNLYQDNINFWGRKLVMEKNWADNLVNAFAEQSIPGIAGVHIYGGLARHPQIIPDSLALVICHELGHHIGGAPKHDTDTWASNEGQADYWGALKCLRKYFEGDNQRVALMGMKIPLYATKKCNEVYTNTEERLICKRSAMAGISLANFLSDLKKNTIPLKLETPDQTVVKETFHEHPAPQCRLDTLFSAALCDRSVDEETSQTDLNLGVCSIQNGDEIGNRPLCWFKP